MSLRFTEEQVLLQQTVREFVESEVAPRVADILKSNEFPADLYRRCGELGFWSLNIPEEYGGFAMGMVETSLVQEEVAKVLPTLALLVGRGMSNIPLLCGNPALERYLEACMAGEKVISCSAADPAGRANAGDWAPFAVQDGNEWVLNGVRHYDTVNLSDLNVAIGMTQDKQMKAFFIPKDTAGMKGTEGYHNTGVYLKYGMPGSGGGTTVYEDCRIPLEMACDIDIGNSEYYFTLCQNSAAQALGLAKGILAQTIEFCKMRTHDFKPLAQLQVVSQKLAWLQSQIEVTHSAVYDAATMHDEAVQTGDKTLMQAWAVKAESLKLFASEMASTVAKECIKLHGGMGYHTPLLHHYVGDSMAYCVMDLCNDAAWDRLAVLMGLKENW